jgi:ribosomal protein S6
MSKIIKYEMMILLTEEFNDNELKTWAFNYAKTLRKLNASEISVISRGKRDLSYEISNQKRGNFIQINFSSIPKYLDAFSSGLKFDSNVLRFLILNKTNNVKKI